MLDRIVVPVDLTEVSRIGIETGKEISRKFGSKLYLLYVLKPIKDIPSDIVREEFDALMSLQEKLKEQAKEILEGYASEISSEGVDVEYSILEGDEVESILDFSKERRIELIVMPSYKRTKVELRALGSVSLRVSSKASSSVLVVKGKPFTEIGRILVNYDFLPTSIKAFEKALAIAKRFGSKITLLHVDNEEHHTHLRSIYQKVLEKKKNLLEDIRNQHKDIEIDTLLIKGNPKEEVLKIINQNSFDLVVIGRRNPADKSRIFLGSLALEVLKNSPVSVLVSRGYNG